MPKKLKTTEKATKPQKTTFYQAVGRRKESTARVRLTISPSELVIADKTYKKGAIVINKKPAEEYFKGELNRRLYSEPFKLTETTGRFITTSIVSGGGVSGQLQAMIHGIARALEKVDREKYRPLLKKGGYLKRDPRTKQRRKAGFAQKARAKKQSPKR